MGFSPSTRVNVSTINCDIVGMLPPLVPTPEEGEGLRPKRNIFLNENC